MSNSVPNLGNVITNGAARKVIYGLYVVAAVILGGIAVYFPAVQQPAPEWLLGAQAVIAYLAIPVGALALVNTPAAPAATVEPPRFDVRH
jgi:hypothetical protein